MTYMRERDGERWRERDTFELVQQVHALKEVVFISDVFGSGSAAVHSPQQSAVGNQDLDDVTLVLLDLLLTGKLVSRLL